MKSSPPSASRSSRPSNDSDTSRSPSDLQAGRQALGEEEQSSTQAIRQRASESSESRTMWALQELAGNDLMTSALSGEALDGFGSAVAAEMTNSLAGIDGGGLLASNTAMARLMRHAEALDFDSASRDIESSSGTALDASQQERMGRAFDHDFSHVRVHTDSAAARAAQALNAHAFALGADLFFGANEFAPGTRRGDTLLAHELTHVRQHDQGRLPTSGDGMQVSSPTDSHEREAYANEVAIVRALPQIDAAIAKGEPAQAQQAEGLDTEQEATQEAAPELHSEAQHSQQPVEDATSEAAQVEAEAVVEVAPEVQGAQPELLSGDDGGPLGDPSSEPSGDSDAPAMRKRNAGGGKLREDKQPEIRSEGGASLPDSVAQRMSAALGHDFSGVRVHTDAAAQRATDDLGARAFALGADVFFAPGEFQPGSESGQRLLAHELAHVKQHDEGRLDSLFGAHLHISKQGDAHEREADQQADAAVNLFDDLGEVSATLGGMPTAAQARQGIAGTPALEDPRASQTAALLDRLANTLGLSAASIDVRTDEAATQRVRALGTRGVMENGQILLDADAYDPATRDGQALLAHEVMHLAQDQRTENAEPVRDLSGTEAGRFVEAEAEFFASNFTAGHATDGPIMAMPEGHSAQDGGGGSGGALVSMVKAHQEGVKGATSAAEEKKGTMPDTKDKDLKKPKEKSAAEKLDDFEDGAEAVADEIEDLNAFDDGADAWDDDEPYMDYVRKCLRNENGDRLIEMYKGAYADKRDGPAELGILDGKLIDRGVYDETEAMWNAIVREAKAQAKARLADEAAQEAAAAAIAQQANSKAVTPAQDGGPPPDGPGGGSANGGMSTLQGLAAAPVTEAFPELPEYTHAQEWRNGEVGAAVGQEYGHFEMFNSSISSAAEAGALSPDRFEQVFGEVGKGLAKGITKGFIDTAFDTLVVDTLGDVVDTGLNKLTKGKLDKAPMVGSAITLYQNGFIGDVGSLITGDFSVENSKFVKGLSDSTSKIGEGFSDGAANFSKFLENPGLDSVGYLFAVAADWLLAIAELLDMIDNILGTLSALSYVLGGLFVILGLCFSWCGLGFLVPWGMWLIRAGQTIDKIKKPIGPVALALRGLGTFFRILAALTVPEDAYAEQVNAVGEETEKFSEKTTAKITEEGANKAKDAVADGMKKTDADDTKPAENDAQDDGAQKAAEADAEVKKNMDDLEKTFTEVQDATKKAVDADAEAEKKKQANPEEIDAKDKKPDDDETEADKTKDDDEAKADKKPTPEQKAAMKKKPAEHGTLWKMTVGAITKPYKDLMDTGKNIRAAKDDIQKLLQTPELYHYESLHQIKDEFEYRDPFDGFKKKKVGDKREKALKELDDRIARLDGEVGEAYNKANEALEGVMQLRAAKDDPNLDPIKYQQVVEQLKAKEAEFSKMQDDLSEIDGLLTASEKVKKEIAQHDFEEAQANKSTQEKEGEQEKLKKAREDEAAKKIAATEAEQKLKTEEAKLAEFQQKKADLQKQLEQAQQFEGKRDELRTAESDVRDLKNKAAGQDADANKIQDLTQQIDQQKAAFENLKSDGQTIKFQGENGPTQQTIKQVNADGIVTGDGTVVPWSKVTGPDNVAGIANSLDQANTQKQQLQEKHDNKSVDQLKKEAQQNSESVNVKTEDVAKLQAELDAIGKPQNAAQGTQQDLDHYSAWTDKQQEIVNTLKTESENKTTEHEQAIQTTKDANLAANGPAPTKDNGFWHDALHSQGASKMGFKKKNHRMFRLLLKKFLSWFGKLPSTVKAPPAPEHQKSALDEKRTTYDQKAEDNADKLTAKPAGPADKKSQGLFMQAAELYGGKGDMVAEKVTNLIGGPHFGALMKTPPPHKLTDLDAQFREAQNEARLFTEHHAQAYFAFRMEEVATGLVDQETYIKEMGESQVLAHAKQMVGPLAEGEQKATERKAKIDGRQTGTKKSDGEQGGLIMGLIEKLMEEGDEVDEPPSTGETKSSGDAATNGQNVADEGANEAKNKSSEQASKQIQAVSLISTTRDQQEGQISSDIDALSGKIATDEANVAFIQNTKAEHLALRAEHQSAAESKSAEYNSNMNDMVGWAVGYKKTRESFQKQGGA